MRLKYTYWYFTKALSPHQCEEIINIASKQPYRPGAIEGSVVAGKTEVNPIYRQVSITTLSDPKIYNLLNPFIHRANKNAGWDFQWDWNEASQFTIYNKGDHYQWHNDQIEPIKDPRKTLHNKIRKLSLSLQLSDSSQYEGGDFQFRWLLDKLAKVKTVTVKKKERGSIIIFPSFVFHRITPIKKGTRLALVNWSLGERFK